MTAETSNARWEVVAERQAWYEQQIALAEGRWAAAFLDRWECGDDVPSKEHFIALWLAERAAPLAAEGVQAEPKPVLSEPDRIGLYQGPDDCPQLMVNDRPVAIFPAGSWAKVCDALDSITGSVQPDPKAEARGVVDEAIKAALAELDALRGAMFKTYAAAANGAGMSTLLPLIEAERDAYENHYSQPRLQAALTEARNVR